MAKHRNHKTIEQYKKAWERKMKRFSSCNQMIFLRTQMGSMQKIRRSYLALFNKNERRSYPRSVIGFAKCHFCKEKIQVLNDKGVVGDPYWDYLSEHQYGEFAQVCAGSKIRPVSTELFF